MRVKNYFAFCTWVVNYRIEFYENKKRRFFSWNFQSIAVLLYWFWFFKIFCWVCKFSNLNVIILWFLWILPCSLLYFLDILLILPARISFRIQIRILTSFLYPVFCLHRFIFPCFNSNPLYCCLFFASHVLWFFLLSIHIQELKPLIFCWMCFLGTSEVYCFSNRLSLWGTPAPAPARFPCAFL